MAQDLPWPQNLAGPAPADIVHTEEDHIVGLQKKSPFLTGVQLQIRLSTAPDIVRWKGVEVVDDETNEVLDGAYTQDDYHGPSQANVSLRDRNRANLRLQFLKAKAFGVHTAVYSLPFQGEGGTIIELSWLRDVEK